MGAFAEIKLPVSEVTTFFTTCSEFSVREQSTGGAIAK